MTLRDLGFSDDQETLYYALIQRPTLDAHQLTSSTGRSPAAIEEDLDALERIGVIDRSVGGGISLKNPVAAISTLVDHREDELMATYRRVSETRAQVFTRISELSRAGGRTDLGAGEEVETIVGIDEVRAKLDELSFFARTSILAVQPGGPQSPAALAESQRLDQRALRRELVMRVIHDARIMDDEANAVHLMELVRTGVEARLTSRSPTRMVIIDEQIAVIALDPTDSRQGALMVRHPGLVLGFVQLFHRLWDDSEEIVWQTPGSAEPDAVDEQDRRVLAQLAQGQTDEVIARTLGCSVRTLRRQIARLMVKLEASSRFEAGAESARRGWLLTTED